MGNNSEINKQVAGRIRQLRTRSGLSQEALALSAQVSPVYLGQLERNLKNPTIEIISKICEALNISLSEFFLFDDAKDETKYDMALHTIASSLKEFPPDTAMRLALIINELSRLNER